jgi:2'-hydroxyisoflavone reductase
MRLLVLGGTAFLSREITRQAAARGHRVTSAARGSSGPPPDGAGFITVDRDLADGLVGGLADVTGEFDAVIDVARRPTHVRRALDELAKRAQHWTFVSSISVYPDNATPGQRVATAPVRPPLPPDGDELSMENYGSNKVSCEQTVHEAFGDRAFIVRAGLIVGPDDPSDRFAYWPDRIAKGGEVLAPGDPGELIQWIDVRDLADWIVDGAERRLAGTFDAVGPTTTRGELFVRTAEALGVTPQFTWVHQPFLLSNDVNPWSGPRSLPLWLPLPEYAGFLTHDWTDAMGAGLKQRAVSETARDTLAWQRRSGHQIQRAGLKPEEEQTLLARWHEHH